MSSIDFIKIYGVGKETARKWRLSGYTSLNDVRENETLTLKQEIGFRYYFDFIQLIPRPIIDSFNSSLSCIPYPTIICGSYRRGKSSSSDIDVLVVGVDIHEATHTFFGCKLLKEAIVGDEICEGVTHLLGGYHRRIDIHVCSKIELPFALLHFTGSKNFNIYLRTIAKGEGYILNEKGLFHRSSGLQVNHHFEIEKDIFDFLKVPFLEPEEREMNFVEDTKVGVVDVRSLFKDGKPNKVIRELLLAYGYNILYKGKFDKELLKKNGFPTGKVFMSSRGINIQFFLGPELPDFPCQCPVLIEKEGLILKT
jgi:DNA polymerase/3'-5' exonuclease PolX